MAHLAADDVAKLLKEVGVQSSKEDIDAMIKAINGRKLHDLVREGSTKLAAAPSGGVAVASSAPAASAAPAKAALRRPARSMSRTTRPSVNFDRA